MQAKCGNLAASAGDIGEARGTQAGEESAQFSAEEIGSKIHEHVAELDGAAVEYLREDFAADRNALLDDPAAALSCFSVAGNGLLDGCIPITFAGFPTEGNAGAA